MARQRRRQRRRSRVSRRFFIADPVYEQDLEVIVGGGIEAFERHIQRTCDAEFTIEGASADPRGKTVTWPAASGRGQCYYLYLRSWAGTVEDYRILVHEALHHVKHVCEVAGIEDDEAECYFLGYLVREILRRL